jgi:hypothetical protein
MSYLRALPLWQPFASLVANGVKTIETRTWETDFRGRFVVCATKKGAPEPLYGHTLNRIRASGIDTTPYERNTAPNGAALAVVTITDCRPMRPSIEDDSDEACAYIDARDPETGNLRFAWVLDPVILRFTKRFDVRCRQGWFRIPIEDVESHL